MKRNVTLNSMTRKCLIVFRNCLPLKIIKNKILKHVQYNPILIKLFLITNWLSTHLYMFTENCLNIYLMSKTVFFLRAILLHGILFFPSESYELQFSTQINWNTLPRIYQIWLLCEYIKAREESKPKERPWCCINRNTGD